MIAEIIAEIIAESEQLEVENESLLVKVGKLQRENQYLRRANQVQPYLKLGLMSVSTILVAISAQLLRRVEL